MQIPASVARALGACPRNLMDAGRFGEVWMSWPAAAGDSERVVEAGSRGRRAAPKRSTPAKRWHQRRFDLRRDGFSGPRWPPVAPVACRLPGARVEGAARPVGPSATADGEGVRAPSRFCLLRSVGTIANAQQMVFNLLLACAVAVGVLWPAVGQAIHPWRKALIVAVMLSMSVTLPGERLRRAAGNLRGLAAAGCVGYVLLPVVCSGLGWVLFPDHPGLLAGMAILGALPCTLASASVWTRLAGGDDALALVYTVVSNVASVALVPAILLPVLSRSFDLPAGEMFLGLCTVVLLPVVVGQVLRRGLPARADAMKGAISVGARGMVLLVVLLAVSSMAADVRRLPGTVALLAGVGAAVHLAGAASGFGLAGALGLPRAERIAVLFAGSQKTLFVGVYLAAEHFPGDPLALLPVTAYHVVQLVLDTLLANRFSRTR